MDRPGTPTSTGGAAAKKRFEQHQRFHQYLQGVTTSLSVVSALIAAALLAIVLNPPEVVINPAKWGETTPACADDSVGCSAWRDVYGIAAPVSLLLELTALLVAVAVTMGAQWLEAALALFAVALWPLLVLIVAALWLTCSTTSARVGTALAYVFVVFSLLPLLPAAALVTAKLAPPTALPLEHLGLGSVRMQGVSVLHWAAGGSKHWFVRWWKLVTLHALLSSEDPDTEGRKLARHITPLLIAAAAEFEDAVIVLLAAGADPNFTHIYGTTPLHVAAASGNLAIIEALLDAGADPNLVDVRGRSALDCHANSACVPALLRKGAKSCMAPSARVALFFNGLGYEHRAMASTCGELHKVLIRLCEGGGEPEVVRVLLGKLDDPARFVRVTDREPATSAVLAAASDKSLDVLRVLRDDGSFSPAIFDCDGDSPLLLALWKDCFKAAAELADWQYGGDEASRLNLLCVFATKDFQAVLAMAGQGALTRRQHAMLVESARACARVGNGWSWSDAVEVLLSKVADPNAMLLGPSGVWETALFAAAGVGDVEIITTFHKDGRVNPLLGNSDGASPLDAARRYTHFRALGELEAWSGVIEPCWAPLNPAGAVLRERDAVLELMFFTRYHSEPQALGALMAACILPRVADPNGLVSTAIPPFAPTDTTPLLVAVLSGNLMIVQLYRQSGRVNPLVGNSRGITPLTVAQQSGSRAMAEEISDWIASLFL